MPKIPAQMSSSTRRIWEYLELIDAAQKKHGFAKWYDIFKRAMSAGYTGTVIAKLKGFGLVREEIMNLGNGDEEKRYFLTQRGETLLDLIRKNPDIVALLNIFNGEKLLEEENSYRCTHWVSGQ